MNKKGSIMIAYLIMMAIVILIILTSVLIRNVIFKSDKFCEDRNYTYGKYYSYDGKMVCSTEDSDNNKITEKFDVEKYWYKYSEVK